MTEIERTHPRELIAEYALGVLPEADAARVRTYLENDVDAMAEFQEMATVARLLPLAAEDREPSEDLLPGVLSRIATEPIPISRGRARRFNTWSLATGAIAAAVLVVAVGVGGFLIGHGNDSSDDALRAEAENQSGLLAAVAFGQYQSTQATNGGVRVAVLRAPGASMAYAYVEGMPSLENNQTYQSWFIADGKSPAPGPLFTTTSGAVWLDAGQSLDGYASLAFTVEPKEGSDTPSQQPFVIVPLQKSAKRVQP